MTQPIERLDEVASDAQHSALYELLVGAASEIPAEVDRGNDERQEEAA